jgi:hypothetical protein
LVTNGASDVCSRVLRAVLENAVNPSKTHTACVCVGGGGGKWKKRARFVLLSATLVKQASVHKRNVCAPRTIAVRVDCARAPLRTGRAGSTAVDCGFIPIANTVAACREPSVARNAGGVLSCADADETTRAWNSLVLQDMNHKKQSEECKLSLMIVTSSFFHRRDLATSPRIVSCSRVSLSLPQRTTRHISHYHLCNIVKHHHQHSTTQCMIEAQAQRTVGNKRVSSRTQSDSRRADP